MKRILIVGKDSYIGNCLETWLTKDLGQYIVEKNSVRTDEWRDTDLGRYDAVVYLAGLVHVKEKKALWPEYLRLNAELPFEFAKHAKECGIPHFLFFSTKGVYRPNTAFIDRETEPNPTKLYGKSKLIGEDRVLSLADDAFRVTVLRPPVVYGAGCKGNFPKLVRLSKRIHLFPKLSNQRSMIYIWNLCEFVRLMIDAPVPERIVFPQDKEMTGVMDIMKALWEERGEHYHLSTVLAVPVKILIKLKICNSLNTMFLNTIYDPRMSDYYDFTYCLYSQREAIKSALTESNNG